MARKKRNKGKCNNNGVSNSEMDFLKGQELAYLKRKREFVCTGAPGTGFFKRLNFRLDRNYPVPLKYAGKYLMIKKESCVVPDQDFQPTKKEELKEPGVLAYIVWIIVFFVAARIHLLLGILGFVAFLLWNVLIGKMKRKSEERLVGGYRNVVEFKTPEPDNVDEYYMDTAELVAQSLDDGLQKTILSNFVRRLRNPDAGDAFVADNLVTDPEMRGSFWSICNAFDQLMKDTDVFRLDYCSDFDAYEPEVSVSAASLYVGAFNYIESSFDIPVFDFGDFQIYLYPSFVIKAYDAFTFEVVEYGDFSIKRKTVKYRYRECVRATMRLSGGRYSVLLDGDSGKAVSFVESMQVYIGKLTKILEND